MNCTLPKGTYFLGDPCYAIHGERWQKIVNRMYDGLHDSDADVMIVSSKDGTSAACMFYGSTAYGDGRYEDQNGNEFPVDTGLIGLVPMSIANPEGMKLAECGKIVTFAHEVDISWDDGVFHITDGNQRFSIDTKGSADENEDEE